MESRLERWSIYKKLKDELKSFSDIHIENAVMYYCLIEYGCSGDKYLSKETGRITDIFKKYGVSADLKIIAEFFEVLLDDTEKNESGVVFTPDYIASYIVRETIDEVKNSKIIDPGCGCGVFLVEAAEYIFTKTAKPIGKIIKENIFGMDILSVNVRRCILILKLLCAKYGGDYEFLEPNIKCMDSLNSDWKKELGINSVDYVIGNPPYVNPHDLNKQTAKFLKENFITTKKGVFNIFYAFMEKGFNELSAEGKLCYIVPNNFLTIKSAIELRRFLQDNKCVNKIVDFGDNMVFKPIRTYNCIIQLTKKENLNCQYHVIPSTNNIQSALRQITFQSMDVDKFDKNGWKLVDEKTRRNIQRIESQSVSIKNFIRTGIATLRDGVYLVEKGENGYYKKIDSKNVYVEDGLIRIIYKIPELKLSDRIEDAQKYIIFPYVKKESGYTLIDEFEFIDNYPETYKCLLRQRTELDKRDNGKGVPQGWYAYGRTQGLNKYGQKLVFPTFANRPKFMYVEDENALFCNGYAVFENDQYDLDILGKILNSDVMDYYVSNTSYSIEGGYYCYQKKYIEKFSLPLLSLDDIKFIRDSSQEDVNSYLWNLYGLE